MSKLYFTPSPKLSNLIHVIGEANLNDYRDRSAPSDFHWKILKCRMLIFSDSSIFASPDLKEVKQIHVVHENCPSITSKRQALFSKFGLKPTTWRQPTCEELQACLQYTMTAKLAPAWNLLGPSYYINNRDFLTTSTPQQAVNCSINVNEDVIKFHVKAVKITLARFRPKIGDYIRVFPSLKKSILEDIHEELPKKYFKSYIDLRRHWKNIHGYRLPEQEQQGARYYEVRFWRGSSCLTYPAACVSPAWPIVVPVPRRQEEEITSKFLEHVKLRLCRVADEPVVFQACDDFDPRGLAAAVPAWPRPTTPTQKADAVAVWNETQAVSLCTPTPQPSTPSADAAPTPQPQPSGSRARHSKRANRKYT